MKFQEKLDIIISTSDSLVCVGLDSDILKIPIHLRNNKNALFDFNKAIIDATHDLVCAYKPNSAFYESYGIVSLHQLKMTMDYIQLTYPDIPVILDAKRADIGNTNNGYVKYAFEYLGADAITLHPYLGREALQPFLDQKEKGCIILCKTSNNGAGELQDLKNVKGEKLYQIIARQVTTEWNTNGNCMLVVGATYPKELAEIRKITGDLTLLIPGIGAQGGNIEKTIKAGLNSKGSGMIINASRSIIYASNGKDFAEKARKETETLKDLINIYR